ncbi:MAG TPA: TolC family protein [Longimicrobiales bacterium]|nr:TolC family protein [Longimicrobiales bacterium]
MRIRAGALALVLLCAAPPGEAQEVPASLTLEQALDIARGNNPTYLQSVNDRVQADWEVRQAYGQLLPSASASSSVAWQGAGEQTFGTLTLGDLGFGDLPSYYLSNYSLSLGYNLNWATLVAPSGAKAQRRATDARIRASEATLVSQVTGAYLEVLRQAEALLLAEQQLENARFNLRLAQGRLEVGQATPIDVGQAEVQVGRSEVAVLQADNGVTTSRMRLLQQLGVPVDQDFTLTTRFELSEPTWDLEDLYDRALDANPTLLARQSSKEAADIGVSSARGAYYPSVSISTGWSGFTREASSTQFQVAQAQAQVASQVAQCNATNELFRRLADPLPAQDCGRFAFTDAQRRAIVEQNDQVPVGCEQSPLSVRLAVSIPIFQGLTRQRNLEVARLLRDDLEHQVREQELALRADLSIALANVRTAYRSALLEERNRELADRQLTLARERYQLGLITFVELVEAQTVLAQADRDRTAAVFAYHDAVTSLEALVGGPLR